LDKAADAAERVLDGAAAEDEGAAAAALQEAMTTQQLGQGGVDRLVAELEAAQRTLAEAESGVAAQIVQATDAMEDAKEDSLQLEEKANILQERLLTLTESEKRLKGFEMAQEALREAERRFEQAKDDANNPEESCQRAEFALGEAEAEFDQARNKLDESGTTEDEFAVEEAKAVVLKCRAELQLASQPETIVAKAAEGVDRAKAGIEAARKLLDEANLREEASSDAAKIEGLVQALKKQLAEAGDQLGHFAAVASAPPPLPPDAPFHCSHSLVWCCCTTIVFRFLL
jgi:chromosome segregation ATPase